MRLLASKNKLRIVLIELRGCLCFQRADQCEKNFFCSRGYHHRGNGGQCNGQKELNAFVAAGGNIATLGISQSEVKVHNQRQLPVPRQY